MKSNRKVIDWNVIVIVIVIDWNVIVIVIVIDWKVIDFVYYISITFYYIDILLKITFWTKHINSLNDHHILNSVTYIYMGTLTKEW